MAGSEVVDLVDDYDNVVGSAQLSDCLAKGLLHRAVAVLVLRPAGTMILQKRSEHDLWHPGLWTISCTGHVKVGESYPEAAERELSEELALTSTLNPMFKMRLPPMKDRSLTEHEWVSFYTTTTAAEVIPDLLELSGVMEVSRDELRGLVSEGPLTDDAKVLLRRYLESPRRSDALPR